MLKKYNRELCLVYKYRLQNDRFYCVFQLNNYVCRNDGNENDTNIYVQSEYLITNSTRNIIISIVYRKFSGFGANFTLP